MTFTNGVATFTLKGGQSLTATGLPNGLGYVVSEKVYEGYTLTSYDNTVGTIAGNCDTPETKTAHFYNTYEANAETVLTAVKMLEGRELKDAEFRFELKDKDGKVLQTKANAADGTVAFDKIAYTLDDVALSSPITYTISEVVTEDKTVIFDETIHTVTVTLTDNGDGTITAKADKTGEEIVFVNKATEVKISKIDLISGDMLAGATFRILDQDGGTVDEWVTEETVYEAKGLKIGETYTIHEVQAPAGYTLADDVTFVIDEKGEVTTSGTLTEDKTIQIADRRINSVYLAVTKEWQDDDNRDGLRPLNLNVGLYANGTLKTSVTLNAANNWTAAVSGTDRLQDGGGQGCCRRRQDLPDQDHQQARA